MGMWASWINRDANLQENQTSCNNKKFYFDKKILFSYYFRRFDGDADFYSKNNISAWEHFWEMKIRIHRFFFRMDNIYSFSPKETFFVHNILNYRIRDFLKNCKWCPYEKTCESLFLEHLALTFDFFKRPASYHFKALEFRNLRTF